MTAQDRWDRVMAGQLVPCQRCGAALAADRDLLDRGGIKMLRCRNTHTLRVDPMPPPPAEDEVLDDADDQDADAPDGPEEALPDLGDLASDEAVEVAEIASLALKPGRDGHGKFRTITPRTKPTVAPSTPDPRPVGAKPARDPNQVAAEQRYSEKMKRARAGLPAPARGPRKPRRVATAPESPSLADHMPTPAIVTPAPASAPQDPILAMLQERLREAQADVRRYHATIEAFIHPGATE